MKSQHVWAMALILGLLCSADLRAYTDCGAAPGDRVTLMRDHPWGNAKLHTGQKGTVICLDPDDSTLPLLVSFDAWGYGLSDSTTVWCHTAPLPHPSYSLWWVGCFDVGTLPFVPDFFDSGEPDHSFKPQTLIAGKANQTFEVNFTVVNGGIASPSDATYVKVYASTDTKITPSDYLIGTTTYFFVSATGSIQKTLKTTFPTNVPPGFYYIGWIIDPADLVPDELDENNNTAYVESYRLVVSAPAGSASLELSAAVGGQVTAPGEGVFVYPSANVVSVEVTPDPNCTFAGWMGTAVNAGKVADVNAASTQVTVDAKYSLKARFDGPHMVLEDFEDYNDASPVSATWLDGLGWHVGEPQGHRGNDTGAIIGNAEVPSAGDATVHGGVQALAFHYDNSKSPYYSEAFLRRGALQNWSATGADKLSIWYRGAASNMVQPLYVVVEDVYRKQAVLTHPDGQAVLAGEWTQWTIPLDQIQTAGVMLSRVVGLYLGVGNKKTPAKGGAGTLYFDDITLIHK